jgi:hypothetical protein
MFLLSFIVYLKVSLSEGDVGEADRGRKKEAIIYPP